MNILIFLIICAASSTFANDVYVGGYYRQNGTYVKPHYRSAPDSQKWNNYGTGNNTNNFQKRDNDRDGIYNQYDKDDNNNGVHDNFE